jgi:hypothetical protein
MSRTVSYSSKGLGPALKCSKDAYDLMLPNWTDIEYTESFLTVPTSSSGPAK